MEKKIIQCNGVPIAVIHSGEVVIADGQSALDFMATIHYDDNCDRIAINKRAIAEDFFVLGTGIAGEILQKVVNYKKKLAIIGDFSQYTSKPLQDFIRESNRGNAIFFVADEQAAIEKLSTV